MSKKRVIATAAFLALSGTHMVASASNTLPEVKALKFRYDMGAAEGKVVDNQFIMCDACPSRANFLAPYEEPKPVPPVEPPRLQSITILPPPAKQSEVAKEEEKAAQKETCKLATVYFKLGSSKLTKKFRAEIKKVAAEIKKNHIANIQAHGYTCRLGGKEINARLSERRAKVVAEELVKNGVSVDIVIGYGKRDYASTVHLELNRRSEVAGEAVCKDINK